MIVNRAEILFLRSGFNLNIFLNIRLCSSVVCQIKSLHKMAILGLGKKQLGIFAPQGHLLRGTSHLPHNFNRSSFAKVLEIACYSCGFAQSDRLNLRKFGPLLTLLQQDENFQTGSKLFT